MTSMNVQASGPGDALVPCGPAMNLSLNGSCFQSRTQPATQPQTLYYHVISICADPRADDLTTYRSSLVT